MIYSAFVKSKTKNILIILMINLEFSLLRMDLSYKAPDCFDSMSNLFGQALENKKFQLNLLDKIIIIELYIS